MNATEEPSVVGVRVRPFWSMVLYALLLASAGVAMWAQRTSAAPGGLAAAAPWIFLVFTVGFAAYRLALVSARRYSPFKAFIQIFIAVLFFMLLMFPSVFSPRSPGSGALESALRDNNVKVRALAAEVAGYRNDLSAGPVLVKLLADQEPAVRVAAHDALVRLNQGNDLGTTPDAWKERFP